jgi:hypothetical protein
MKKHLLPGLLALSLMISLAMAVLKPVPHGHRYDLAVQLSLGLNLIWLLGRVPLERIFKKSVLAAVFIAGLGWGIFNVSSIGTR